MQSFFRASLPVVAFTIVPAILGCADRANAADPDTKIRWSRPTQSYEFDTGTLFGCIAPHGWYHGIAGLMHRDELINVVRPRNALINAEYYLQPGSGTRMYPRQLSSDKKTTHSREGNSIVIEFPPEPDYGLGMQLTYTPHGDAVDMNLKITPTEDVPKFEIFFASYIVESFRETWIPLRDSGADREWTRLSNREVVNDCFGAVRDEHAKELLADGRWGKVLTKSFTSQLQEKPFTEPILIARNPETGFSLVFLCDPNATTFVGGQHHTWDTAHDWSFGTDLTAGETFACTCRLIYRCFANPSEMTQQVNVEWARFVAGFRELNGE